MTSPASDLLQVLSARGFIEQCTDQDALDAALKDGTLTGYIGFDCTASSLHVGSLVQIMLLHWMQQTGHRPIALFGGGTSRIGDPSGKDTQRQLLDDAAIRANKDSIKRCFSQFVRFGEDATGAIEVDNADWLDELSYIPFLRDYGRHFSVNRMLTFDSVKLRLDREQPLSFLEFNYMILQAYDFLELQRRYGCTLQSGGRDQWGNIVNGVELVRRVDSKTVFGLTTPLITTADGKKMGKTEGGAVWLNTDMLSAWDYWQFWRNTADADVVRFLKLFTTLPMEEIARLEALEGAEINDAKKMLANEATAILHGREAADKAEATARETFEGGGLSADLPTVEVPRADLEAGIAAFDMFRRAGLAGSGGEARRLIKGGGAKLNDAPVSDENAQVTAEAVNTDGVIKLSAGKKKHVLVKPV